MRRGKGQAEIYLVGWPGIRVVHLDGEIVVSELIVIGEHDMVVAEIRRIQPTCCYQAQRSWPTGV